MLFDVGKLNFHVNLTIQFPQTKHATGNESFFSDVLEFINWILNEVIKVFRLHLKLD
jgi:hypothetical protein